MRKIEIYEDSNGRLPFQEWLNKLENSTKARIYAYIIRVVNGATRNNIRPVGDGVFEIKVNYGPGYRIYYYMENLTIFIILLGGEKKSQKRDIEKAYSYLIDHTGEKL